MDCERERGEVLEEKTCASDNKRVIFSPGVKVLNTDDGGGCGPRSEITFKEIEHVSARSSDSSDTVSPSSSKAPCGDTVRVNPQILPNSIVGESRECRESISQPLDVEHACLVKDISPILSPPIQVMECPEDYDPDSPAYVFNSDSPTMEENASSDDLLFSIHMENDSFSADDATSTGVDLNKSGQSLSFGEFCQSGEAYTSGEMHKTKECRSTEKLKSNESKRSDELGRFDQISPTTKGVEQNKTLDMEKNMRVDVKREEKKEMVGKPINNVREGLMNNRVETSTGCSKDTSSKQESDGTVAFPKKKKSSWKSCHCFTWPSCWGKSPGCSCKRILWPNCSGKWIHWPGCSFKWLTCRGCLCEKPSSQLKYPRWAGGCFKCLYWPCLKCRC